MHRRLVLIITSKDDAHADHIIQSASAMGWDDRTIRINTEDFALNSSVLFDGSTFSISLRDSGRSFHSNEVASVWFRRPKEIVQDPSLSDAASVFARKQWVSFLRGLYFATHDDAWWYNPLTSIHRARIKLQQLVLAKAIGLRVPKMCVTNDRSAAINFFSAQSQVCTKSLDEPSFEMDGHYFPMYTRLVGSVAELDDAASIQVAPVLFQEFIRKTCDVRVVVVDESVFAVRIESQKLARAKTDFREVSPHLLSHEVIELPDGVQEKILQFMNKQHLRFSAMDFCIDSDSQEFVFLENNCNGQWLWLERQCDVPITDALLRALYRPVN